jgi:hypothetical protein
MVMSLSALDSCMPHHEISATFFNMQQSSTEPLRVVKYADMVLTTFGISNYSG